MAIFSSTVFSSTVFDTGSIAPIVKTPSPFLGGGYHTYRYEQMLLAKAEQEALDAKREIELEQEKLEVLQEQKTETIAAIKHTPAKDETYFDLTSDLIAINKEISLILESIQIYNDLHSQLMRSIATHRNNINLLIISAACPFNKILTN